LGPTFYTGQFQPAAIPGWNAARRSGQQLESRTPPDDTRFPDARKPMQNRFRDPADERERSRTEPATPEPRNARR